MSAGSAERRQRIREQLREFYGDPTASRERPAVDSVKSGVSPEMDLDSEFFNVSKYVTDLLRRESLKELVETDTQLLRTVRLLDGELQELVYQNYAKFISATDTIREMRDNITEMDAKLQALSSNVDNIDKVSRSITDKLQTHRSRIEEMISTNRMLRKVQFLVNLADTMRKLIERKEYSACVKYWTVGDSFLAKHTNLFSIAKIRDECRTLAQQLYKKLQETVVNTSLDDPEAMDIIRCVVEDMRHLRDTSLFPKETATRTESRRESADITSPTVTTTSSSSTFEAEIVNTLMQNVSGGFAAGIQSVNSAIRAALAVPNFASIDRTRWADVLEQAHLEEALAQLKSLCALFYSNSERVYGLFNHKSDMTVSLRIVEEVQPVLIDIMSPITSHLSDLLITTINAFCSDGEESVENPLEMESNINAIFKTLARRLKYYSSTLKTLGVNYLDNAHSQQSRQYAALVDQSVLSVFQRLLTGLEAKLPEGPSTPNAITSSITGIEDAVYKKGFQFCMTRFFFSYAVTAADKIALTELIAADTLRHADVTRVQSDCTCLSRAFSHRGIILLGQLHLHWIAAASCPDDAVDPTSVDTMDSGVALCLREFVQQLGVMYALLRKCLLSSGDSVVASVDNSLRERRNLDSGMGSNSRFYTSAGSGRGSGGVSSRKLLVTFMRQKDNILQSSVERIFSKQSQSNAELRTLPREIRAASVVAAVVVYVLKGIVEYVRKRTFSRNGFQCVQISCTFLLYVLTPPTTSTLSPNASHAGDERCPLPALGEWLSDCRDDRILKVVPQLINECCTCAYERCKEKVPLTAVVVDGLVKSALESMQSSVKPLS